MAKDSADKEQLDIATKLNQQRRDALNLEVELRKETQIIVNSGKQITEYSKLLAEYKRSGNAEAAKEADYLVESYKIEKDRAILAAKTMARQKKLHKFLEDQGPLVEKVNDLQEKYNKELEKSKDTADELAKPFKSITKSLKSALGPIGGLFSDVFDKIDNDAVESIQKTITGKLSGTKGELDSAMSDLDSATKAAGLSAKDLGIEMGDTSKKAVELANSSGNIGTSMAESTGNSVGMLSKMKDGFGGIMNAGKAAFSGLISGARAFMATLMANPIFLVIAGVVALGAALFAVAKRANHLHEEMVDITREQGLTNEEALKYMGTLNKAQTSMSALGMKLSAFNKEMAETQKSFSDIFQTSLSLSDKNIQMGAVLQVQYGLTADEAVRFQEAVALNGESIAGNINLLEETVSVINKQTNMGLRQADVAQAIAKSSKSTLANYKNMPIALTKAFAIAKQFGTTLERTEAISESLLNIEESIGAEMEARVLTGKNINLNEARYLALQGDTAGALKSMVDQVGSYEEIQEMLPFQQKALAKAMGMTRDELLTAVTQQSIVANLTEAQIKNLDTLTTTQIDSMTAAQLGLSETQKEQLIASRMQQKASEMTEGAMGKAGAFFDAIAKKGLMGIFGGDNELSKQYKSAGMNTAEDAELARVASAKQENAKQNTIAGTPIAPAPPSQENDFISRPGQAPISFNKDDIIIGATNPFGGESTGGDNTELISIIKEQNVLLKQLVATTSGPTVIKIGSRTIEELDSQIGLRKNYNTVVDSSYGNRT